MYISLLQADIYLKFHDFAEQWNSITDEEKEWQLIRASKQIDLLSSLFKGIKKEDNQEFFFPRLQDEQIPISIQEACAELAAYRVATKGNAKHKAMQEAGVGDVSLNGVSYKYNGAVQYFPAEVLAKLQSFFPITGTVM